MKRWKKWTALGLALFCLPVSIFSVEAEGENGLVPSGEGVPSSEESQEDERRREEPTEEIEITAQQVTTYMEERNTLEGITFYYRPEEYDETIADEDVVDLLDDIELAGISQETGEVVCTLEEEDDTDDFVSFLSEEGRWLIYMDPEYREVIQIRQIVSLLDNELLYISQDHSTLELYNDDYDEVERSFTTDGTLTEDGYRAYTNEDGWLVTLTENCDAVVSSARFVTENDRLALYVDDDSAVIGLYDKENNKMWWSTPEQVGQDPIATNAIVNDLFSSLKMTYGEPAARKSSTMRSKTDADIEIDAISDGVEITYEFDSAGITIPVTYTLGEDYLEARVDTSQIVEENTGSSGKLTTRLTMMGAFGAASTADTGYFVIPDGSGALIRFNNGKVSASSYTGYVYGSDVTAVPLTEPAVTQQIYLPMYGIVNGDDAMMVVCTEGDSNARLLSSVSRQSNSSYNTCGFEFILRDSDSYYMAGDTNTALTMFEDGPIKTDSLALRYYPLTTEETPDYGDVAQAYRDYLLTEGGVTDQTVDGDPFLAIDLYGGVEKVKSILGIPIQLKTALTTYDQAQDILGRLQDGGAEDLRVQYHNWTNNGIAGKVDDAAKASGTLGGGGDWDSLLSFVADRGIVLYPAVNNETFVSGNGYYSFTDTAVRISGSYARLYPYNLAYGTQSTSGDALSLLSPAAYDTVYGDLAESYQDAGLSRVSLGSLSNALYGDYGKQGVSRDGAQARVEEAYQMMADAGLTVLGDTANAYALPYLAELTNLPLQSSGYDVFDEDIPFLQMVLHGVMPYASTAVNASADPAQTVLTAVAYGSSLHYDMIAEETSTLKDTVLDTLYYASADAWIDDANGAYAFSQDVLAGLGDATIMGCEQTGDVITTTYSDGTEIIVDLAAQTAQRGTTIYALSDYLPERSWNAQ